MFADPDKLSTQFPEHGTAIQKLIADCQGQKPELINDNLETAPSKRIITHIPKYKVNKSSDGPAIAKQIGLPVLREKCPHFGQWLTKLENLTS